MLGSKEALGASCKAKPVIRYMLATIRTRHLGVASISKHGVFEGFGNGCERVGSNFTFQHLASLFQGAAGRILKATLPQVDCVLKLCRWARQVVRRNQQRLQCRLLFQIVCVASDRIASERQHFQTLCHRGFRRTAGPAQSPTWILPPNIALPAYSGASLHRHSNGPNSATIYGLPYGERCRPNRSRKVECCDCAIRANIDCATLEIIVSHRVIRARHAEGTIHCTRQIRFRTRWAIFPSLRHTRERACRHKQTYSTHCASSFSQQPGQSAKWITYTGVPEILMPFIKRFCS